MSDAEATKLSVQFSDLTVDEINARHRKEKKELQAKIQEIKKNAPKNDKKKRKEAMELVETMEKDMKSRHEVELNCAKQNQENDGALPPPKPSEETTTQNGEPARVSKAQKRREKKARDAQQRDEEIRAAMEEAQHAPKAVEYRTLQAKLKERDLALREVPSDGDCLYNAIRHQLQSKLGLILSVKELRTETANYIRANKDTLIHYLTDPKTGNCLNDVEFQQYCEAIVNKPTWGGQVELKALSSVLKTPIEVLQAEGPPTVLGADEFAEPSLIITYHRLMYSLGEHYNSTMPLSEAVPAEEE